MSGDLEKMTVKQKIKELKRWQEMQHNFCNTQDQISCNPETKAAEDVLKDDLHGVTLSNGSKNINESGVNSFTFKPITRITEENEGREVVSDRDMESKPRIKRPFLKRGAGLARFRMALDRTDNCDYNIKYRVIKPNSEDHITEDELISKEKNIKKPSAKLKLGATVDNCDSKKSHETADIQTLPSSDDALCKGEITKLESDDIPCWADVLHQQSDSSVQRETDELRMFEMLEEKVVDSSFCSSSSMVARLMEFSVRSTPKKVFPFTILKNDKMQISEEKRPAVTLEKLDAAKSNIENYVSINPCSMQKHSDENEFINSNDINEASNKVVNVASQGLDKYGDDDKWSCSGGSDSDFSSSEESSDKEISFSPMTSEGQMILSLIAKYKELAYLDSGNPESQNSILHSEKYIGSEQLCQPNLNKEILLKEIEVTKEDVSTQSSSEENVVNLESVSKNGIIEGSNINDEDVLAGKENGLQEYIKKVQDELKKLEKETERVMSVRSKYEEEFRKFQQEKAAMLKGFENDRQLFEIEMEEERKKLQKEKAVFEKHSKPLRNKPTLRHETELKVLQEKVLSLEEELKEKQKNWGISQSSIRSQLHSLVETNKNLRQEIATLKEKEQKDNQKKKRIWSSFRGTSKAPFKSINEHIESLDSAVFQQPTVLEEEACLQTDLQGAGDNKGVKVMLCVPSAYRTNNKDLPSSLEIENVNQNNSQDTGQIQKFSNTSEVGPDHCVVEEENTRRNVECFGDSKKVVHQNGDIQFIFNDGTVHYYFAESDVWHKKFSDGIEIFVFKDGQMEMRSEDGTYEVVYPNGCRKVYLTSGKEIWHYANGDTVMIKQNGEKVMVFLSGQIEIHRHNYKLRQYPDGACKFLYANGVTETRYPDGRVRIKDKHGILVKDNKQDIENEMYKIVYDEINSQY